MTETDQEPVWALGDTVYALVSPEELEDGWPVLRTLHEPVIIHSITDPTAR